MIWKALQLLLDVHHALTEARSADAVRELLYDSGSRRVIDALLDLLSLEGIYPNLCPGVGVPIDRRISILHGGLTRRSMPPVINSTIKQDLELLGDIAQQLGKVGKTANGGLSRILQERIVVDLFAALFQLAYQPAHENNQYKVLLQELMNEYVAIRISAYAD